MPLSAVAEYAISGQFGPECEDYGDFPAGIDERVEYFDNLLTLLEDRPNYHLVLLDDHQATSERLLEFRGSGFVVVQESGPQGKWRIFYESKKAYEPNSSDISVAFYTDLPEMREGVERLVTASDVWSPRHREVKHARS